MTPVLMINNICGWNLTAHSSYNSQPSDSYLNNSHAASRHAHGLIKPVHKFHVTMPLSRESMRAAHPSYKKLKHNSEINPIPKQHIAAMCLVSLLHVVTKPCVLLLAPLSYSIPQTCRSNHCLYHASFDLRIARTMERTLVDSGATCCWSKYKICLYLC